MHTPRRWGERCRAGLEVLYRALFLPKRTNWLNVGTAQSFSDPKITNPSSAHTSAAHVCHSSRSGCKLKNLANALKYCQVSRHHYFHLFSVPSGLWELPGTIKRRRSIQNRRGRSDSTRPFGTDEGGFPPTLRFEDFGTEKCRIAGRKNQSN